MEWINRYPRWHRLLEVNPGRLLEAESPFKKNPDKIFSLLEKFRQGGPLYAPIVGRRGEGICIVDGRHRTFIAAKRGLSTIKIAVPPEEADFVQSFFSEDTGDHLLLSPWGNKGRRKDRRNG